MLNPGFSERESRAIRPRRRRRKDNQETFTFTLVNCPSFRMLPHPPHPPPPACGWDTFPANYITQNNPGHAKSARKAAQNQLSPQAAANKGMGGRLCLSLLRSGL